MSDFTSKWPFDFKLRVYELLRAEPNGPVSPGGGWMGRAECPWQLPFTYFPFITCLRAATGRGRDSPRSIHGCVFSTPTRANTLLLVRRKTRVAGKRSTSGCNLTNILFKHVRASPAPGERFLWKTRLSALIINHRQPRSPNSSILDPVYKSKGSVTHYSTALVNVKTQNVASCFISSQKKPQRLINECRHIKEK